MPPLHSVGCWCWGKSGGSGEGQGREVRSGHSLVESAVPAAPSETLRRPPPTVVSLLAAWAPNLTGVFPEGEQRGRVRRALGEGGRNSRRQGRLGRRFSPGTWNFPDLCPPRAPLAPVFTLRNHSTQERPKVPHKKALSTGRQAGGRPRLRGRGGGMATDETLYPIQILMCVPCPAAPAGGGTGRRRVPRPAEGRPALPSPPPAPPG